MSLLLNTDKGKIEISKDVFVEIASRAASECYGLAGISTISLTEGFTDLLKKDNTKKGVRIEILDDNRLVIEVSIIVIYGTKISEVAHNVMEKVHYTIENITGAKVEKVNIRVQGVKVVD